MNEMQHNKRQDLNHRRCLIKQHEFIHGLDYISIINDQQIKVHFIQPEQDLVARKPLPALTLNNIKLEVIVAGDTQQIAYQLEAVEKDFSFQLTLKDSLKAGPDMIIRVTLDAQNIDRFFNCAELSWDKGDQSDRAINKNDGFQPLPRLNYLAKDYDSFRQLIEAELSHSVPGWQDRDPADMIVAINEVLAYAGDMLSYKQDVVATEAYLNTARFELSMRRHCRLLDYEPEGDCAARTWVAITVDGDVTVAPGTPFFCGNDQSENTVLSQAEYKNRLGAKEVVFEAITTTSCENTFNQISLYNFGIADFSLKSGATSAALKDHISLKYGQLVAFIDQHQKTRTQVVRLTEDAIVRTDPLSGEKFTHIRWHNEDALQDDWSVENTELCANIVLVDRGETQPWEALDLVASNGIFQAELSQTNVKKSAPIDVENLSDRSARFAMRQDKRKVLAMLDVLETPKPLSDEQRTRVSVAPEHKTWTVVSDFLNSTPTCRHVVIDEYQGSAHLRFGNGTYGAVPNRFNQYYVRSRISPEQDRKVATGVINQLYFPGHEDKAVEFIEKVQNLSPAIDQISRKTMPEVKLEAPFQMRNRVNLACPQDYIDYLCAEEDIRNVSYFKIWSGSQKVYQFYIYPQNKPVSEPRLRWLEGQLSRYKMLNHHFVLLSFSPLMLHINLSVSINHGVSKQAVYAKLHQYLSDDVKRGVLAAKNFDFGVSYHQSQLLQAVLGLPEVATVHLNAFQSLDQFVGNNQNNVVAESIEPEPHQVICFKYQQRRSFIEVDFMEVPHV